LVHKVSRIKVYNALTVPILLYGGEILTLRKKREQKTVDTSRDIFFFRITAGCTLFYNKINEEILVELTVEPVDQNLRSHKSNWLRHVKRMNKRMPKIMLNFRPKW
jgi:hypothetical protein